MSEVLDQDIDSGKRLARSALPHDPAEVLGTLRVDGLAFFGGILFELSDLLFEGEAVGVGDADRNGDFAGVSRGEFQLPQGLDCGQLEAPAGGLGGDEVDGFDLARVRNLQLGRHLAFDAGL